MSNEKTHGQRIAEKVFYHVVDTTQKDRLAETIDAVIAELIAPNPVEIDQIKPEPPAPAAMSADNFLKETALYIAEATQHKHRALSSSGVEDYFRHYGDLRAQEAVRDFAHAMRRSGPIYWSDILRGAESFINTTKG